MNKWEKWPMRRKKVVSLATMAALLVYSFYASAQDGAAGAPR